ncbi:ribosomal protein S18-alanine N-acetyltransferase [Curvivirga aplysinae]|uniref:ribosomal protein S18-alanine N-acetyltransferase n=1 Tax=Curvivirga aplysinae TaxID=2529852 RepID=UPI0012BC570E|nr:ribosomal protein S18-alanine N-acetyltransferase [Curvivirga aplysinae]MTI08604.1 ribosomal-protein-alanine N-acetyltransferase [Curvivirga aplysinae]
MTQSPYQLSALQKTDLKEAANVYGRAFVEPWGEAALLELLRMKGAFGYRVTENGSKKLVAFVLARSLFEEAEILTIAVDPIVQGQGLAFTLMQAAEVQAKAQGAEKMFLEVAADNKQAQGLYFKLGYEELSRRKGYYKRVGGIRVDAYNLWKKL